MANNHVKIIKPYMQFGMGDILQVSNDSRQHSVEILHSGRKFDVPTTHCRYCSSFGLPVGGTTPPVSPWIDDDDVTLSGLMGDDPFPSVSPVAPMTIPSTPPPMAPVAKLKDNQVHMSHFTKGKLPISKVDHLVNLYPSDTWGEEHWVNIPDIDPNYVWNPNMLEALILGLDDAERVLFVGMPGTGKTTGHKQFAAIIGQPFYAVNGKDGMEPSSYLGSVAPDGDGGWAWSDGALPTCMKEGYYLCIDEVFKIPAGIQMSMQSVWERGGHLVLDDKPGSLLDKLVKADDKFRIMATDNVKGLGDNFAMFSGTQMQDTSTLDRFDTTYTVPYMDEDDERCMLMEMYPDVDLDVVRKLVQVANLIRKGYAAEEISLTLSPRGLMSCCRKIDRDLKPFEAFRYAYLEKLADDVEIEAVKEFTKTCGLAESIW